MNCKRQLYTDLLGAEQRDHGDEVPRDAHQHEEDATDGGEVQQPPRIADEQDHRSWILQNLLEMPHLAARGIVPGLVTRHPPILRHLRKAAEILSRRARIFNGPGRK